MSKQISFKKYQIFGVEIDSLTNAEAIDYITSLAGAPKSPAAYITKPYVEFLDKAYKNDNITQLLNNSQLCVPDGVALNWAVTYLFGGQPNLGRWFLTLTQIVLNPSAVHKLLPGRAGGTNLAWPMLRASSDQNLRVFLIGTPDHGRGDISNTAAVIKARLPAINIVGHYGGYFPPGDKNELIQKLKNSSPDLILVGMGFPRQEQLMSDIEQKLTHGVMIGEGGTFDYASFGGTEPKAPQWMQTVGLEWFWRLLLEPTRIQRQLAIPRFIWRIYLAGRQLKKFNSVNPQA